MLLSAENVTQRIILNQDFYLPILVDSFLTERRAAGLTPRSVKFYQDKLSMFLAYSNCFASSSNSVTIWATMAYLVPIYLALPPNEESMSMPFLLRDENDIPNDTYNLLEYYCANPDCNCFNAVLRIFASQQNTIAARVFIPLELDQPPYLDTEYPITPTS